MYPTQWRYTFGGKLNSNKGLFIDKNEISNKNYQPIRKINYKRYLIKIFYQINYLSNFLQTYIHERVVFENKTESPGKIFFNEINGLILFLKNKIKYRKETKIFLYIINEIIISTKNCVQKLKDVKFKKKLIYSFFSRQLRYFNFVNKFIKTIFLKKKVEKQYLFHIEEIEFNRIFLNKNETFLMEIFNASILSNQFIATNILSHCCRFNKDIKTLFILKSNILKQKKQKKILYISMVNWILINKLFSTDNLLYLYISQKTVRWKNQLYKKSIFKYLKKEIFLCFLEILEKNFQKYKGIEFLKNFKFVLKKIFLSSFFYNFNFLQESLFFLKNLKKKSLYSFFLEKSNIILWKKFLINTLNKIDFQKKLDMKETYQKKKVLRKCITSILKKMVLSNGFKKFIELTWYFLSLNSLRNTLEASWRIQIKKKNTGTHKLGLNCSLNFNNSLVKFIASFNNKLILKIFGKFFPELFSKSKIFLPHSNNLVLLENFFWRCYSFSGLNSHIILKQINRILTLGNFYLLTFFRIKKIIKARLNTRTCKHKIKNLGKKNRITKIFLKKIEILSSNLKNSLEILKAHNFF